ncbi:RNA-directed DNA polymerase from mobile element jockey [Araneus ventricosus]|uniref:RNA-directed DNA polymerase from mobile element jockey n=1 Tax=Araneus ventricosus TaxID=182803 RepID=A0A4Y2WM45_ARAVE|nr:RNA-directed DNA polymerase from mobile element jockey [Araneus ventricosus]
MSSDHNPVLINFFLTYSLPNISGKFATNWNHFTTTLNKLDLQNPYCISSPSQLDEYVCNIESQINHARIAASKPIKPNTTYIDARLKELSAERNHARKTFQSTRNPALKRYLNKINKQINKLDQKIEINSLATEMTNVNIEDGTIWKFVRPFKKKFKKIPPLTSLAGIANTDTEKANCLANSLEAQFTVNNISHPETEEMVKESVTRFRLEIDPDNQLSDPPSEIQNCIKNLKNNKAPGLDRINNKMIKNLPKRFLFIITTIIHKIMILGHFPTCWKTATVVPIYKPGKDPTDPASYRPISLLSSLSKIAEHIILNRLNKHLNDYNILCSEQFGFREKLSTTHQLLRVVEYITEGFSNKQKTGAVFLDIQKAFDRVWQDGLIYKLINYNTPKYLVKIIDSYLNDRKFAVRVNNTLSDSKPINAGVAQGSKIGPILFSLYINDIPRQFNTMLCMYADDTAILARNKNPKFINLALNRHLKTLEDWFAKWKIEINVSKTEAILFSKDKTILKYPPIKMNNKIIPWSQECKHLGLILDRKLTWRPHFYYLKQKSET